MVTSKSATVVELSLRGIAPDVDPLFGVKLLAYVLVWFALAVVIFLLLWAVYEHVIPHEKYTTQRSEDDRFARGCLLSLLSLLLSTLFLYFWLFRPLALAIPHTLKSIWGRPPSDLGIWLAFVGIIVALLVGLPNLWFAFKAWVLRRYIEQYCDAEDYEKEKMLDYARYYVRPLVIDNDPTAEEDFRAAYSKGTDLFRHIDRICKGGPQFVLVFADAGMGKTAFVINYFLHNARRRFFWRRQRIKAKYLGLPGVIERINEIPENEKSTTTLILDGFDELGQVAKGAPHVKTHLKEIATACIRFKHIIVTCRNEFLAQDTLSEVIHEFPNRYPRPLGETPDNYCVRWLSPFNNRLVRKYVRRRYWPWQTSKKRRLKSLVRQLPEVSMRPMVLTYGPQLIERQRPYRFLLEIYSAIIEDWIKREKTRWKDPKDLRWFSRCVAALLFKRGDWRLPQSEYEELLKQFKIPKIERFKASSKSLLNVDSERRLKFAHTTFMEYFLIQAYWDGKHEQEDPRVDAYKRSRGRSLARRTESVSLQNGPKGPGWSRVMQEFLIDRLYLEVERRADLLEAARREFANRDWPPQWNDEKLFDLFHECVSAFGQSFTPKNASSRPTIYFDLSDADLGGHSDYRASYYERINMKSSKPLRVLVGTASSVTDHDTGLVWHKPIVCKETPDVRRALGSVNRSPRLPTSHELEHFLTARPFVPNFFGAPGSFYWIEDPWDSCEARIWSSGETKSLGRDVYLMALQESPDKPN